MQKIKNVTIGIDWEIYVNSLKTGFSAGKSTIKRIVDACSYEAPELEIGEDQDLLEIRIGIAKNFSEFHDKVERAFELCSKIARKNNVALVPYGYRETDHNPAGGHVHAGSMESFTQIAKLYSWSMPFAPALIALASASPGVDFKTKSLRIFHSAGRCSTPMSELNPRIGLPHWGDDICVKYPDKATLEFRAADSQPFTHLVEEISTLYVGLISGLSRRKKPILKPDVFEYGMNRLNASLEGMQATFCIEGRETTPTEIILEYVLPLALDGLNEFGVPGNHFGLVEAMAKKRVSPADWIQEIIKYNSDPWRLSCELTRVIPSSQTFFTEWLKTCKPKKTKQYHNPDEVLLDAIALGTPLLNIYMTLPLPLAFIDKMLQEKIREGKISKRLGDKNEQLFDRTDLL